MAKNKKTTPIPGDDSADTELVAKVDAMMDAKRPQASAAVNSGAETKPTPKNVPEIDIFKGVKTAPELSSQAKKGDEASNDKDSPDAPAAPDAPAESEAEPKPQKTTVKHEGKVILPIASDGEVLEGKTNNQEKSQTIEIKDSDPYADSETDKAVSEIVAHEADQILAAEDVLAKTVKTPQVERKVIKTGARRKLRIILSLVIIAMIAGVLAFVLTHYHPVK